MKSIEKRRKECRKKIENEEELSVDHSEENGLFKEVCVNDSIRFII